MPRKLLSSGASFFKILTLICWSYTLNWSCVAAKPKCILKKKHLPLFLQYIAPVDQRSFAAGTAAVSSALSGSVTAMQTVPTTLTNCLWTSNAWPQVRLLFGSQLESLHQCHKRATWPGKWWGHMAETKGATTRRASLKGINLSRSIVRSKTSPNFVDKLQGIVPVTVMSYSFF